MKSLLEVLWERRGGLKKSGKKMVTYGWPPCQSSKVNIVAGRKSTSIRRFTVVDLGLLFWRENFTQNHMPILETGQWVIKERSVHCVF